MIVDASARLVAHHERKRRAGFCNIHIHHGGVVPKDPEAARAHHHRHTYITVGLLQMNRGPAVVQLPVLVLTEAIDDRARVESGDCALAQGTLSLFEQRRARCIRERQQCARLCDPNSQPASADDVSITLLADRDANSGRTGDHRWIVIAGVPDRAEPHMDN